MGIHIEYFLYEIEARLNVYVCIPWDNMLIKHNILRSGSRQYIHSIERERLYPHIILWIYGYVYTTLLDIHAFMKYKKKCH